MATEPERIILTYDDYAALPSGRERYELFEGEIQVTPAPNVRHQRIVRRLLVLLDAHVREKSLGEVLAAPCDVLLSETTVVQPDLLFVTQVRSAIIESQYVRGAPDLVVEVLSGSTAQVDRQTKRQLYARYGVAHYWLIDPDRREATALILQDGSYQVAAIARANTSFAAEPFPDLVIRLSELWD